MKAVCHYNHPSPPRRQANMPCSHGTHQAVNASNHLSNKQADRPVKKGLKDSSPITLGVTTTSENRSSNSMPRITPAYRTSPTNDSPLHNHAMGSPGILDVPETVEGMARANASPAGPTLDLNSGYGLSPNIPFIPPVQDLSFHSVFNACPITLFPEEQWQWDPGFPIYAPTYDYLPYVPEINGYGITIDVREFSVPQKSPLANVDHHINAQEDARDLGPTITSRSELRSQKQDGCVSRPVAHVENTETHGVHENLPQIKWHEKDTPDLRCPMPKCLMVFKRSDRLLRHKREVHRLRVFPCLIKDCPRATYDMAYPRMSTCYQHMQKAHRYAKSYGDFKSQAESIALVEC